MVGQRLRKQTDLRVDGISDGQSRWKDSASGRSEMEMLVRLEKGGEGHTDRPTQQSLRQRRRHHQEEEGWQATGQRESIHLFIQQRV